jgi:uncharacterized membrane protein
MVNYTLIVTNTGAALDSFNLTVVPVSGSFAAVPNPTTINNLAAGASTTINVAVTIPGNALPTDSGVHSVIATSQGNPSVFATAALNTTVNQITGVSVSASPSSALSGPSPGMVTYTLTLTNQGNIADIFDIAVSGGATFTAVVNPATVTPSVPAFGTTSVTVEVTIPAGQLTGATDTVTVTFTSQTNTASTTQIVLTTTVQ